MQEKFLKAEKKLFQEENKLQALLRDSEKDERKEKNNASEIKKAEYNIEKLLATIAQLEEQIQETNENH